MTLAGRLQEATSIPSDVTQDLKLAMEVGPTPWLTIYCRKLHTTSPTGTIYIQTAPVLDNDAFVDTACTFTISGGGGLAAVLTNPGRYIRWRAGSVTGTPRFLIDVIGRDGSDIGGRVLRLQEPMTLSTDQNQRLDAALDILNHRSLAIVTRKLVAGASAKLYLQHSPTLEESAFIDVDPSFSADGTSYFDLGTTGNEVHVWTNLLRYLRWRGDYAAASAVFTTDVVARGT